MFLNIIVCMTYLHYFYMRGDLVATYPIKTKRKMAAVMRAPREAGDSMPSMANTEKGNNRVNSPY